MVGIAGRAEEALELMPACRPDIVLLDLGLPDESGLVLGADILERWPEVRILVLSALDDRRSVDEAVHLGFHGYLTKDTPVSRFEAAIRAVMAGTVVVPRYGGGSSARGRSDEVDLLAEQLTARELEVLGLLVEGRSGAEIAARLTISPNTVRTHVQSVLTKLQVHSRLEAVAFAVRHGLASASPGRPGSSVAV